LLEIYQEKVKLVSKSYPLVDNKISMKATIAALATDRQGKFWEFHDLLFFHSDSLNEQVIEEIAMDLGLDMEQFKEDLDDPEILRKIRRDILDGSKVGVGGVPAIFINGRLLKNGTPESLKGQVEKELAKTMENG
jgi:protein-disulfide isomerase